jgi:hypothetical protein
MTSQQGHKYLSHIKEMDEDEWLLSVCNNTFTQSLSKLDLEIRDVMLVHIYSWFSNKNMVDSGIEIANAIENKAKEMEG